MSIDARELRIGNYIMNAILEPFSVKNVHETYVNELVDGDGVIGGYSLGLMLPIPLTPEILVDACGFEKTHFGNFYRIDNGKFSPWLERENDFFDVMVSDPEYSIGEVRNIHQLQNLYFALTGEELPIDIKVLQKSSPQE